MSAAHVDRRTFLATSGVAIAGAAVGVMAQTQPARRRLALAGTGSRGSGTWGDVTRRMDMDVSSVR